MYVSEADAEWFNRKDEAGCRKLVGGVTPVSEVGGEVKVIQAGGHFDGSNFLLWEKKLFIADTMMSVPVSTYLALVPLPRTSKKSAQKTTKMCGTD